MCAIRPSKGRPSCLFSNAAKVLDENEQVERIGGGFDEVEMAIERLCLFVLRMYCKRANSRDVRGLQCSLHRIPKQAGAHFLPLPTYSNAHPSQEHYRYWMPS